ncbi:MAG: peptidoglycan editing factor PgeF [Tissierellales bacterium]|nr:peptidoglycan editing factor PgeF [Tissierellales bacterium]
MNYDIVCYENNKFIYVKELRQKGLYHCFTTKDMDIGLKTTKDPNIVKLNLYKAYEFIGKRPTMLFNGLQVHGDNVMIVNSIYDGIENNIGRHFNDTDGLMTNKRGIGLITRFADCTPIIIYDPVNKVHANIHSGWRGTLKTIVRKAIDMMIENFSSIPTDLIAVLGPSIDKEDFEVEEDVYLMFEQKFSNISDFSAIKNTTKYLIDIKGINKQALIEKGLKQENVIDIDLSTYSTEFLHSYRRDKESYGLMGAITLI